MKRRQFITFLGAAATWPFAVRAQQGERMRRVGILMGYVENDPEFRVRLDAIIQGLAQAGWIEDRNIRLDVRWTNVDVGRTQVLAKELIALQPDVLVAATTLPTAALHQQTRTLPIVFASVADPVGEGFVASLARPGGNITGVSFLATAIVAKQLEMLHQVVPSASVVGALINPTNPNGESDTREAQEAARNLGIELHVSNASTEREIDWAIAALVEQHAGALLIQGDPVFFDQKDRLIALVARHSIPAISNLTEWADGGGLIYYGTSIPDADRVAAGYVGRILKGEKPADLPVQQATKFEFIINLKTAKALGLTVPPNLLAIADEVIE